jgi:hypothetical protein
MVDQRIQVRVTYLTTGDAVVLLGLVVTVCVVVY